MSFLALITGALGSGKTTICSSLFTGLRSAGYPAAGIVEMVSRNEDGLPIKISFRDLSTHEEWLWTERVSGLPLPQPFTFPEEPLERAIALLSALASEKRCPLILDEIGLLEIESGKGFLKWILDYLHREDSILIASLRKGREEALLRHLSGWKPLIVQSFECMENARAACLDAALKWTVQHCRAGNEKVYLQQNTILKRR